MNGILTKTSRIYKTTDGLACNIPTDVLPPPTKRIWEDTSYVEPGYRRTTPDWINVAIYRHPSTRLVLTHRPSISPAEIILSKGLDPTKPVQIRARGSRAWITAHPYHTTRLIDEQGLYDPTDTSPPKPVYGRATLQWYFPIKYNKKWSERTKELWRKEKEGWPELYEHIRSQDLYQFQIRGTSLPRQIKRGRWKEVREDFGIKYLNNIYPVTEYKDNFYRWDIPKHLKCYLVLNEYFRLGYQPEIEFYLYSLIYVNFKFPEIEQQVNELKRLKRQNRKTELALYGRRLVKTLENFGKLYRNTSGMQISLRDKKDYEFYFTLKSHYLSLCPQTYYVAPDGNPLDIMTSLAWTNQNLLWYHPGLANIRAGFQIGENLVRRKWNKRRQRMTRKIITRYESPLQSKGEISKDKSYVGYENEEISIGESEREYGQIYWLYYAEKIAIYTDRNGVPLPAYDNERIENTMITLGARRIYTDLNGFVWRKYYAEQMPLY